VPGFFVAERLSDTSHADTCANGRQRKPCANQWNEAAEHCAARLGRTNRLVRGQRVTDQHQPVIDATIKEMPVTGSTQGK
jgi:hypothetical protein